MLIAPVRDNSYENQLPICGAVHQQRAHAKSLRRLHWAALAGVGRCRQWQVAEDPAGIC